MPSPRHGRCLTTCWRGWRHTAHGQGRQPEVQGPAPGAPATAPTAPPLRPHNPGFRCQGQEWPGHPARPPSRYRPWLRKRGWYLTADRKRQRLHSSYEQIAYAVVCVKKKRRAKKFHTLSVRVTRSIDLRFFFSLYQKQSASQSNKQHRYGKQKKTSWLWRL